MNTSDLMPTLSASFESCEELESGFARCEHRVGENVRSVYFIKSAQFIPTDDELHSIQSTVIAPSFFASQDDSRWNHYLIFLVPPSEIERTPGRLAKIETDTSYARKLIIADDQLSDFIRRRNWPIQAQPHNANDLQLRWSNALQAANLDAVVSDLPRAEVVRSIRNGQKRIAKLTIKPVSDTQPDAFFTNLKIDEFGTRRLKGNFSFGRVNLIRGANGAGKTSLLEAIEHFLCGGTSRGEGQSETLRATASFRNTDRSVAFRNRPASYFQQRDLKWYGRKTRGNRLFEGFARYNFLNTDAPVDFSRQREQQDLTTILSRVALGPDANIAWERIQKVIEDIRPQISSLKRDISRLDQQISSTESRLSVFDDPGPELSSRLAQIDELLALLGWPESVDDLSDPSYFETLAPLKMAIDTLPSDAPSSIHGVKKQLSDIEDTVNAISASESSKRETVATISQINTTSKATEATLRALERLREYHRVGFYGVYKKVSELSARAALQPMPSVEAIAVLRELEQTYPAQPGESISRTIDDLHKHLTDQINYLHSRAQIISMEIGAERSRQEELESLRTQIIAIGRKILSDHRNDSCPLCHTHFEEGELILRIERSLTESGNAHLASIEEKHLDTTRSLSEIRLAHQSLSTIIREFPYISSLSTPELDEQCRRQREIEDIFDAERRMFSAKLESLIQQGFNYNEYSGVASRCSAEASIEWNEGVDGEIELMEASKRISARQEELRRSLSDAHDHLRANDLLLGKLSISVSGNSDPDEAREELFRRRREKRQFLEAYSRLPQSVRHVTDSNLRLFSEVASLAYSQIIQAGADISIGKARNAERNNLTRELAEHLSDRDRAQKELDNFTSAEEILNGIVAENSLEQGLSDFLRTNLDSIQSIFERIHVPNELRISSLNSCELIRNFDNSTATLSQISTGQRAALVLSVFLTLNGSLHSGPPLMLIDDPVAHIDDINSLALLDYLGDVAESGTRQIFFATADDKLANLFVRKMSFLGDEFRAINLERTQSESVAPLH
ncbi:TPA: AAA family ATPase [Stenotrophomonas maltophilia]|uniref:ABC-three component system middle component 1 n=1 Tax=Stenotrophomonas maltophilia TaxID=40324 RepID=UPI001658B64C|nr:ABC-three component system middle component 1 [Stenotrophomonas maltophilia]MBC9115887.1 AAA family ATPase [Stenotrophomonas maltophilia]HEL3005952.1 AAA family ATPase [Stenotrophomonas maltophilia]HEL4205205.1 AAA family ATPase [Stenotrophomonas maltophilia]